MIYARNQRPLLCSFFYCALALTSMTACSSSDSDESSLGACDQNVSEAYGRWLDATNDGGSYVFVYRDYSWGQSADPGDGIRAAVVVRNVVRNRKLVDSSASQVVDQKEEWDQNLGEYVWVEKPTGLDLDENKTMESLFRETAELSCSEPADEVWVDYAFAKSDGHVLSMSLSVDTFHSVGAHEVEVLCVSLHVNEDACPLPQKVLEE